VIRTAFLLEPSGKYSSEAPIANFREYFFERRTPRLFPPWERPPSQLDACTRQSCAALLVESPGIRLPQQLRDTKSLLVYPRKSGLRPLSEFLGGEPSTYDPPHSPPRERSASTPVHPRTPMGRKPVLPFVRSPHERRSFPFPGGPERGPLCGCGLLAL